MVNLSSAAAYGTAGERLPELDEATPGDPDTTIQVCMAPALIIRRGPGVLGVLPRRHGFTLLVNQCVLHSRGRITLRSADPTQRPLIEPNYFSDERDLDILARGAQRVRELATAPSLATVIEAEIQPAGCIRTLDRLETEPANRMRAALTDAAKRRDFLQADRA